VENHHKLFKLTSVFSIMLQPFFSLFKKTSRQITCITMIGTRPIFYVVPITQQHCTAVEQGQYPEKATKVRKCVVGAETQLSDGMERLAVRLASGNAHNLC
jgi:hypothetical protein